MTGQAQCVSKNNNFLNYSREMGPDDSEQKVCKSVQTPELQTNISYKSRITAQTAPNR